MYTSYNQVPFYRKNWYAILTFFLFSPLFFFSLFTGPVYYQRGGQLRTYSVAVRWFFAILLVLALASAIFMPTPAPHAVSMPTAAALSASVTNPAPMTQAPVHTAQRPVAPPDSYAASPVAQTYGPAIKGLQLGNDYETTSKVLGNMASDMGDNYTEDSPNQNNQLFMPSMNGGSWLVITEDGFNPPLVLVHFNDAKAVDYYEIRDNASDLLFGAAPMSAEEFSTAISQNYHVNLDMEPPSASEIYTASQLGQTPDFHYAHEGNNWRIDVSGKDIKLSAIQPQNQRFD